MKNNFWKRALSAFVLAVLLFGFSRAGVYALSTLANGGGGSGGTGTGTTVGTVGKLHKEVGAIGNNPDTIVPFFSRLAFGGIGGPLTLGGALGTEPGSSTITVGNGFLVPEGGSVTLSGGNNTVGLLLPGGGVTTLGAGQSTVFSGGGSGTITGGSPLMTSSGAATISAGGGATLPSGGGSTVFGGIIGGGNNTLFGGTLLGAGRTCSINVYLINQHSLSTYIVQQYAPGSPATAFTCNVVQDPVRTICGSYSAIIPDGGASLVRIISSLSPSNYIERNVLCSQTTYNIDVSSLTPAVTGSVAVTVRDVCRQNNTIKRAVSPSTTVRLYEDLHMLTVAGPFATNSSGVATFNAIPYTSYSVIATNPHTDVEVINSVAVTANQTTPVLFEFPVNCTYITGSGGGTYSF